MRISRLDLGGPLAFLGLLAFGCSNPTPTPPETSTTVADAAPATAAPEVSINAVMVALVDHAAHNLWEVEREGRAPKTEADWENVVEHAVQMVAAGPAITVGGRARPATKNSSRSCRQKGWCTVTHTSLSGGWAARVTFIAMHRIVVTLTTGSTARVPHPADPDATRR